MKSAVINSKEIFDLEKNPTLCISAKRYTNNCANCRNFLNAFKKYKKNNEGKMASEWLSLDEVLKRLKCKPIITGVQMELLRQREVLFFQKKEMVEQIEKKMKAIDGKLGRE